LPDGAGSQRAAPQISRPVGPFPQIAPFAAIGALSRFSACAQFPGRSRRRADAAGAPRKARAEETNDKESRRWP